ncbi:MAG: hypothetical protein RLZZ94_805 [Bacteroidota bacterium]|jgi:hypothetical protein
MKKPKIKMFRLAIFIAVLTMGSISAHAQKVSTYQSFVSGLSATDQQTINGLINGAQPTAVVNSTGLHVYGNGSATVLDFKINDFNSVNFSDPALSNVKVIKIRANSLSDFSQVIDMSSASVLSQLSCVYILSSVNATTAQFNALLLNVPSNATPCYSVSIPE